MAGCEGWGVRKKNKTLKKRSEDKKKATREEQNKQERPGA
jgi:hypothetical protein